MGLDIIKDGGSFFFSLNLHMAKDKRKELIPVAKGENAPVADVNPGVDQSWVEVRKQRVIILIPALPQTHSKLKAAAKCKPAAEPLAPRYGKLTKNARKKHHNGQNVPVNKIGKPSKDRASISPRKHIDARSAKNADQQNKRSEIIGRPKASNERETRNKTGSDTISIRTNCRAPTKTAEEGSPKTKRKRFFSLNKDDKKRKGTEKDISRMDVLLASVDRLSAQDDAIARGITDQALKLDSCLHQTDIGSVVRLEEQGTRKWALCHMPPLDSKRRKTKIGSATGFPVTNQGASVEKSNVMNSTVPQSGQIEKLNNQGVLHQRNATFLEHSLVLPSSQLCKALTLRRQLEKAGGLSRWLFSIGLGQFIEAFKKKAYDEVDLLQLSMEDLKKLGKPAVGPRRKFIWAIDHLSKQLV